MVTGEEAPDRGGPKAKTDNMRTNTLGNKTREGKGVGRTLERPCYKVLGLDTDWFQKPKLESSKTVETCTRARSMPQKHDT
jgi:hypothetical protein